MLKTKHVITFSIAAIVIACITACLDGNIPESTGDAAKANKKRWVIPDTAGLADDDYGSLVKYGRQLVVNTAYYFGPDGIVARKSNGMNCQNCHMDAGTKLFGNNFSLTASGYPRFKERSGTVETLVKKVEDCFERSLNGSTIDSSSREMKAFVAYLQWIGKNVKKGAKPTGSGIEELKFPDRAADTAKGRLVYAAKCQTCHGKDGEGKFSPVIAGYTYPPLWGPFSYNIGASLYRVSKFAGYVSNNMPFGASHKNKQLSDEEAWDVAAFVNSQPRPLKNVDPDWPKLATKPYDYPFGPFAESKFPAAQHKYGPFGPIKKYYSSLAKKN